MRLVFIGDVHLEDKKPPTRLDDYTLSVAKKIDWILGWCRENSVDKIIFLGDIFSKKEPGGRSTNMLIKIFKKHYSKPNAPDLFVTIGNHDTSNDHDNIKSSTLWALIEIGYLKKTEYDPDSRIAFKHNSVHIDTELKNNGLSHPEALIWSVHASIAPIAYKKYQVDFSSLNISGPAKLIVCGHIHDFYKSKREDGRALINPGNIGRAHFSSHTKDNPVQILVVDHNGSKIEKVTYVPVEIAEPYDKVFDMEKIKLRIKMKKLIKKLSSTNSDLDDDEYDGFSLDNIIGLAKKKFDNNNEVLELITQYIGAANDNKI